MLSVVQTAVVPHTLVQMGGNGSGRRIGFAQIKLCTGQKGPRFGLYLLYRLTGAAKGYQFGQRLRFAKRVTALFILQIRHIAHNGRIPGVHMITELVAQNLPCQVIIPFGDVGQRLREGVPGKHAV